jgi:methyl-accepting chemotaxis protein
MKLYGKLLLGLGAIIGMMIVVIGVIAVQFMTIIGYLQVSKKASVLVERWDAVQIDSFNILSSPHMLNDLEKQWNNDSNNFEAALRDLTGDRRVSELGKATVEQVENTKSVWAFTQTYLEAAQKSFGEFNLYSVSKYPTLGRGGSDGLQGEVDRLAKANLIDSASLMYYNNLRNALRGISLANDAFKTVLTKMDTTIAAGVQRANQATILVALGSILLSILLSVIFTIFFAQRLTGRAKKIEESMRRVAERDFTHTPPPLGSDEIGKLSSYLKEVMVSLGVFFESVRTAANNVSALKDSLSSGTTESAAAVHQINKNIESIKNKFTVLDSAIIQATQALEEMGKFLESLKKETESQRFTMEQAGTQLEATISEIGGVSGQLNQGAQRAEALKQVVADGADQVQSTNDIIKTVSRDIDNIGEIIDLIDEISEQTNTLSMNAAIESAHAGAAGAGFAVVAEEIRKLAESTQENAQRIAEALNAITEKMGSALRSSDLSAQALGTISGDVGTFAEDLQKISSVAEETSQRSIQVGQAIRETIGGTKRVSEGTEEMYQRHRAVQDAMENIRLISDETLSGITEIDMGSKEILESVIHVEEISLQSKERAAELEAAVAGFKTTQSVECEDGSEPLDRGVAVKVPPKTIK